MRIEIEISDREFLDLDVALAERVLKLNEDTRKIYASQLEAIKNGLVPKSKELQSDLNKIREEITSLNSVINKLFDAVNHGTNDI